MIVNLTENGWEIIYHRAHALLAAQLAGQWRKSDSPVRLYETIAAISHHDDLEKEWEGNELTDAGAPLDFTLDHDSSLEKIKALLTSARYRGRWVTFLTSKHICFLNQTQRGKSSEWDEFLNQQLELQEQWRKELGIDQDEAERAYQFMRWCDRLSLILAQKKIPDAGRALEITSGIDGQRYDIRELADGRVTVEPWPFGADEFTVNVESCQLSELKFRDNKALTKALQEAPIEVLEWTFAKQQ
ncbi:DUF3891 family protein [Kovacikia minuta CCNUW1]|uniref:DUF3891 family protein n=1 Tax=Kovacikia minuta TaxID=2931930 RepID=UPI001CCF750B|nr:DUF3891 family protein [Kovacikia minuta]UBF25819.1 DUF3891 family protein [Kovacikia minuta CCNUW1]